MMTLSKTVAAVFCIAATVIAATDNSTVAHDLFIASDLSVGFGLNIPNDSNDVFFTLFGPDGATWVAVGLGSDKMAHALMFIIYASSSGSNVTISPRRPTKHSEPEYSPDVQVELLPGSGIRNGTLIANVRCGNCHDKNDKIGLDWDLQSTSQKMIYASGPGGSLNSDKLNAALKRHAVYGSFTMDMTKATGAGGVPEVPTQEVPDVGATETMHKVDKNFAAPLHAAIMIFSFLCLMPFGLIILRVLGFVRWHAINQSFAAVLSLVGAGLGIYIGGLYNRTKKFNSGHQVLGIIIIAAMVAQVGLGFMHHRIYQKTQAPTKMAPIHIWLGRGIIPAGIINAFLGFPLALSPGFNYYLIALVVAVALPLTLLMIWKTRRNARQAKLADPPAPGAYPESGASMYQNDIHLQPIASHPQPMASHPPAYSQNRPMDTPNGPPIEPWSRV